MDFDFTEDQNAVGELAREILDDRVTNEQLKQLEASDDIVDLELWKGLANSNLLGVAIAEEHGGMDLGFVALCKLLEEVGRAVAPVPVFSSLVLGALPLSAFGSDREKAFWLPRIANGEAIVTAALQELETSDPLRPRCRATRNADGYSITGEKTLVSAAQLAKLILVPTSLDTGEVMLFLVNPGAEGVSLISQATSDGQPHAHLKLDGVQVSEGDALGGVKGGKKRLEWLVERAMVGLCAMQTGVVTRALEMTSQYGRERVQFERPIGSFQAFHQRAADAYIESQAIRLTTWEAAWRLSNQRPAADAVAIAKYVAAEGGQSIAFACQHLHGGIGIDLDYPLHRYFRWATQIEHTLGCAPAQLQALGDRIAEHGIIEYS